MATATAVTKKVITLELTEQEAMKLKAMVQNALHEFESDSDKDFRISLWNAIETAGIQI